MAQDKGESHLPMERDTGSIPEVGDYPWIKKWKSSILKLKSHRQRGLTGSPPDPPQKAEAQPNSSSRRESGTSNDLTCICLTIQDTGLYFPLSENNAFLLLQK